MRKSTKLKNVRYVTNVRGQGYHESSDYHVNYAFQGFTENLYFTSDRTKPLDENFRLSDGQTLKGFGLEIELESWSLNSSTALIQVLDNLAYAKLPENLFKYQRDGSLGGGESSIEAITQVMTKEFIRNNYGGFRYAFDVYRLFEISASRSGNCGMHVNMSNALFGRDTKTQMTAIKKFVYFVNHNFGLACALVNRSMSRTSYCGQMRGWSDKQYAKNFDLSATNENQSNHGVCFNIAHFNTGRVELRLVGGQTDYFTFRNTMETIFHLIDACKTLSWDDMDDMTKVFKGCNKYVLKRLDNCTSYISRSDHETIAESVDSSVDFGEYL